MYQAIQTRYIGPTNFRGARVKAQADAGALVVSWDHALNAEGNHRAAAEALRTKLGWNAEHYGCLIGGSLPGKGYAFCFDADQR